MSVCQPADSEVEIESRVRAELERRTALTPAMLHSIDERGRLVSVSDAWLAKLGYARDEVIGRPSSDFLTAESREHAVRVVLPEFFRSGRCDNVEYQMICKNGAVIDVLLSAVLDKRLDGRGVMSLAVITDVTALNAMRRQLTESEARYRSLVEDQSELVSLASPEGELRYVNYAYASLYGARASEIVGRNLLDFVPVEDRLAVAEQLRRVCEVGCSVEIENKVVLPSGEARWLGWTNRALRDSDGRVVSIHSVGRDIDKRVDAERRVHESEARYRFLTEHSGDIIALLGCDGTRFFVSAACRTVTGFEPEEMCAMRTADTTHPDDLDRVLEALRADDGQSTVIYRMRRKDGGYVWVETTCKPVEVDGRMDRRLTIVRDIDARVRAERQLQESEARYRFLAENSADLIMLVGHDGRRQYASPACRRLLGYEPEEMLAIRSVDAIHPDDRDRVISVLADRQTDGTRIDRTLVYRLRRKDGSYVWVETTGRVVDIVGQEHQRLIIVRDIEQRMMAEQRLKTSEARYRLLADNSTDMVFQLDPSFMRQYVSPACREILGYEPDELIGISPLSMAHPEDAARLGLTFQSLLSDGVDRRSSISRVRHKNGRWIWVEAQFRALKDPDTGELTGITGALRDVSGRKAVEDELAAANRRLKELADKDGLTGLLNRRVFDEVLLKEHRRAKREKTALSVVMIDVDRFKGFNDRFGHPAGDECLRRVGAAIAASVYRPADVACRYGGEEFAVLLPQTDEASAASIAERIREAIVDLRIEHAANAHGVVTISLGVACAGAPTLRLDAAALVKSADEALYRAKDGGRNKVVRSSTLAEIGSIGVSPPEPRARHRQSSR